MRKDLLLDDDFDLMIANGDLVVGSSVQQESALITFSHKGEWRAAPLVGFGISNYLKKVAGSSMLNTTPEVFKRDLEEQLEIDGMTSVVNVTNDLSEFKIELEDER